MTESTKNKLTTQEAGLGSNQDYNSEKTNPNDLEKT